MAMTSTTNRLTSSSLTPPPSPIPTGKGSRSAANSIFSDYIDRSKRIPELTLPEYIHPSVLADIDYQSLKSRDGDSVNRLLRSAVEFGMFRIISHGISADELRSAVAEVESVFGISTVCCRRDGDREEFAWCRSDETMAALVKEVIGPKKYRTFSQNIENIARKLEAIAEEVVQIISRNTNKQTRTKIEPIDSKLILYRHNNNAILKDQNPHSSDATRQDSCKYGLSLHLPFEQAEFRLQSARRPLSFNTTPEIIIVTIGEQLKEWSLGEFKTSYGEIKFEPDLHRSQTSFSFELRCSPSNLNLNVKKTISIGDQILFVLILVLVYNFFALCIYS